MRKILPIILIICVMLAALTGCGKKQTAPKPSREPDPGLFEVLSDDRATVFAANYEADRPVCVTYIATDNGTVSRATVYDAETIDAVFDALSALMIGEERAVIIDGYDRTFVFTMEDGREYSFSFNIASVDVDGTDRAIRNDTALWLVDFPLREGSTLADILAGGDEAVASSIYEAEPTGAEFSHNGGGVSFSGDPDIAAAAAESVRTAKPGEALTEEEFALESADETPMTLRLIMDDGSQYTFRFAGGYMRSEEDGEVLYYACPEAVEAILALKFDGYDELRPALDEAGRKTVGDALISAEDGGAVLLIRSDYIPSGASFVLARDVTVAGTRSRMRIVYNFGEEKNYKLAADFAAVVDGDTLDRAGFEALLHETAGKLGGMKDKYGLTPAQYAFLWRAQLNDAGEIVGMEKINVD